VSSKITVIENILDKVDHMIIGGGTLYFVKALGGKIGILFVKMTNKFSFEILRLAKEKVQIHIPVDVVAKCVFK
jgi:phosphoglycerate kinase